MKEVENYLNNNFGQDIPLIKRPKEFYYINLSLRLQKLELVIANTLSILKEGIQAELN